MNLSDPSIKKTLVLGWVLLALWLPLGLTLEALHGFKVSVYLTSELRRELWTLAHAHGGLLGIVCLLFAAIAGRAIPDDTARASIARALRLAALLMPLGFFLGGILSSEGDASPGVLLVPVGAVLLLFALFRAALATHATGR